MFVQFGLAAAGPFLFRFTYCVFLPVMKRNEKIRTDEMVND